jgi:hypothetical protein
MTPRLGPECVFPRCCNFKIFCTDFDHYEPISGNSAGVSYGSQPAAWHAAPCGMCNMYDRHDAI